MAFDNALANEPKTLTSSEYYLAVTKSDTTDFDTTCRAIYVGDGGDVVAVRRDGTTVTFKNVQTGTVLPIIARRINSTSTTAADMVALF